MTYWLTNNQSPKGSFSGEDCLSFNPSTLTIQLSGSNWLVSSVGAGSMLAFDNQQSANDAIEIIEYYEFDEFCFVDRPNPPMTYFRK